MGRTRLIRRGIGALVLSLAAWMASGDVALAKTKHEPQAPQVKSYAMPYAFVVLGIVLGVLIVSRPSNRDDQPKMPIDGHDD